MCAVVRRPRVMPYKILILSMSARMIAEPSRPPAGAGSSQPASLRIIMPGHLTPPVHGSGEALHQSLGAWVQIELEHSGSAWVIGLFLRSMVVWC